MTDPVRPVAAREAIERTRIMFEQHRDQCWEQVYTKSEHGSSLLARDFAVRAEVWDLAARCLADSLAAVPVPCAASPADLLKVESYRVEPDADGGDWHILTFANGHQRHILTRHPLVEVEPETH